MSVVFPYLPAGRAIRYAGENHPHMRRAKELARAHKSNLRQPSGAVVAQGSRVIGEGSIGDNSAHRRGCIRVVLNMPTGQGYELCPGCSPENHSEARAIRDAKAKGNETRGADLYLWGHWWCCEPCWKAMIEAGIRDVYLLEGSEELFNKSHPDSIVGERFTR